MAITVRHVIPLVGPYVQAMREFGADVQDEKTMWSFSAFKYNEGVGLTYNKDYNIRYIDEEFPEVMEDFTLDSKMDRVKEFVKKAGLNPVNIMLSVPPCAGLSTMGAHNELLNRFMLFMVKMYLATDTDVLCFENAPALSTEGGAKVISQIQDIIKSNGYDRQVTLTQVSTAYHGIPQNRKRTFAYVYKGNSKVLNDVRRTTLPIYEFIPEIAKKNPRVENDPMNCIPCGGEDIEKFIELTRQKAGGFEKYEKNTTVYRVLACDNKVTDDEVKGWNLSEKCYPWKYYCQHIWQQYIIGKGWWDDSPLIVKDALGALTSKNTYKYYITKLGRCLTLREIIDLMGYPADFMLPDTVKSLNVICQNIPVTTAADSVSWAIQLFNGTAKDNPEMNGKVTVQSQHGNFANPFEYGTTPKAAPKPKKQLVTAFTKKTGGNA